MPAVRLFVLNSGMGAASGSNRVKRGGSWNNNASNCTVANRNNNNPDNRNNNIGFRLLRPQPGVSAEAQRRTGLLPAVAPRGPRILRDASLLVPDGKAGMRHFLFFFLACLI